MSYATNRLARYVLITFAVIAFHVVMVYELFYANILGRIIIPIPPQIVYILSPREIHYPTKADTADQQRAHKPVPVPSPPAAPAPP